MLGFRRFALFLATLGLIANGVVVPVAEASPSYPVGRHPYPRGDEWPKGLRGPFALGSLRHELVPSFDGVVLDGWIYRPKLPRGLRAPVVLWTSPYFGETYPTADDPAIRDNSSAAYSVPIDLLVRSGYAVAVFNVRGSGNSGGCFEMGVATSNAIRPSSSSGWASNVGRTVAWG